MFANPLQPDLDDLLARTPAALWEALRGQTVFITGGTGFFGWWLLETFAHVNRALGLSARAVVLTRDPAGAHARHPHLAATGSIRYVPGDVRCPAADWMPATDEPACSFLIHAATPTDARLYERDPLDALAAILDATRHALAFARSRGTRRMLFTSSGAVYGVQPPTLPNVPESYPGAPDCRNPRSAYAEGKRAAELMCACADGAEGLEIVTARCFAFIGPGLPLDQHFAVGNFLGDALANRPLHIKGDGTTVRSYLYAADLARWLWTLLLQAPGGGVYNVGSDRAYGLREVAEIVARSGRAIPLPVRVDLPADPATPPARYVPDVTRAGRDLALHESVGLEDAVARTLTWGRGRTVV